MSSGSDSQEANFNDIEEFINSDRAANISQSRAQAISTFSGRNAPIFDRRGGSSFFHQNQPKSTSHKQRYGSSEYQDNEEQQIDYSQENLHHHHHHQHPESFENSKEVEEEPEYYQTPIIARGYTPQHQIINERRQEQQYSPQSHHHQNLQNIDDNFPLNIMQNAEQQPYHQYDRGRNKELDISCSQKSALTTIAQRALKNNVKPQNAFEMTLREGGNFPSSSYSGQSGVFLNSHGNGTATLQYSQMTRSYISQTKQHQDEACRRLLEEGTMNKSKKKELEMIRQNENMKDCTFRPATNINKNMKKKPLLKVNQQNAKRFYDEEIKFVNKKLSMIQNKKQHAVLEDRINPATGKPTVCPGSQKIMEKKQQQAKVHERLYKNGKDYFNRQQMKSILPQAAAGTGDDESPNLSIQVTVDGMSKLMKQNQQFGSFLESSSSQPTFKPAINKKSQNIKRTTDISSILHQDALRRNERINNLQFHQQHQASMMTAQEQQSNLISKNSSNLMFHKFESELAQVVHHYDASQDQSGITNREQFDAVLATLGFIERQSDPEKIKPFVPDMLYNLWACVCPDPYGENNEQQQGDYPQQSGYTTYMNLRTVLGGILNYYFPSEMMKMPNPSTFTTNEQQFSVFKSQQPQQHEEGDPNVIHSEGILQEQDDQVIQNTSQIAPPQKDPQQQNSELERNFGVAFNEAGEASLTQKGQIILHNKFKEFFYTYQKNYNLRRKEKSVVTRPNPTFKPSLCSTSKRIDISLNKNFAEQEDDVLTPVLQNSGENAIQSSMQKKASKKGLKRHDKLLKQGAEYQKKRQQLIEEKKKHELDGLQFKPKILGEQAAKKLFATTVSVPIQGKKQARGKSLQQPRNLKEIDLLLKERAKQTIGVDQEEDESQLAIPAGYVVNGDTGGAFMIENKDNQADKQPKNRIDKLSRPVKRPKNKKVDLQFEKQKEQCSFHPKISKFKSKRDPNYQNDPSRLLRSHKSFSPQPRYTKHSLRKLGKEPDLPKLPTPFQSEQISSLVNQKDLEGTLDDLKQVSHMKMKEEAKIFEQSGKLQQTQPDAFDEEDYPNSQNSQKKAQYIYSPEQQDIQHSDQQYITPQQQHDLREVILQMNVKLQNGQSEILCLHEGESAKEAATLFAERMGISLNLQNKLEAMVQQQMNSLLSKIEEEEDVSNLGSSKNATEILVGNQEE